MEKPLARALSFMNLDGVADVDEKSYVTPACKKPRLADKISEAMETPMRVVPLQTVLCRYLSRSFLYL